MAVHDKECHCEMLVESRERCRLLKENAEGTNESISDDLFTSQRHTFFFFQSLFNSTEILTVRPKRVLTRGFNKRHLKGDSTTE